MVFFAVLAFFVIAMFVLQKDRPDRKSTSDAGQTKKMSKMMTIPDDAHNAVERFASIAYMTQSFLRQNGWLHCDQARAFVQFSFGEDDFHSKVRMSFDFDTSMEGFHERFFGYQLGEGFTVEGDRVRYEAAGIKGLQNWLGVKPEELAGGGKGSCVELIAITFLNSCPGAYLVSKSIDHIGCFVDIKFR